ncbi:hypothetical protein UPYG_G00060140 [Umbra pygmaea]|uniref:B-cell receptor CD22 n=1 Tax=Umbra pygmaea TaxID=75934 RepID=A0ABD0X956_UMBPY
MSVRTTGRVLVFLWTVTVVLGQNGWSVTYSTQSICIFKGSTVDLSCSYSYPSKLTVTSTFWFINNDAEGNPVNLINDPDYRDRVRYNSNNKNEHILTITDLRKSDSAEYMFRFITDQTGGKFIGRPGVILSVPGLQVNVVGENTGNTLTCSTTCPLPGNTTYIWYKNGQHIDESTSAQYKDSVYSNYGDSYSCAVKGHEDLLSPTVCVQGQDCSRVIYTKRRICVLKGSSVDISCTYDGYNDVTSSLWFSPKQSGRWRDKLIPEDLTTDPGYAGRVEYPDQESRRSKGPFTLRITDLREEDSAEYRFTFKTYYNFEWGHSLPGTILTVTGLQVKMTPSTCNEGQNVTLTCSSTCTLTDNPTYTWYKKNVASPKASGQSYSITNIRSEDSGEYYCEAKNEYGRLNSSTLFVDVHYGPKNTSVSVSPSGEIVEGSSVTLTCSSDANPPVYKYTWYKKNETSPKASGQSYSITNIRSQDSGEYYCEAENVISFAKSPALTIIITGKQNSFMNAAVGVTVFVLVIICLSGFMCFRKKAFKSNSSDRRNSRETAESAHPDSNSDMYTALNMKNRSPEYDTLTAVHHDPNSDTYTALNMKNRSPEYDTLDSGRDPIHDTDA